MFTQLFDFDELDALIELEKSTVFDFDELDALESVPAFASFNFEELDALESASSKSGTSEQEKSQPLKTVDPETNMKIQQALADAVQRRRKEAGLAEQAVGDSDVTMKIQQVLAQARSRAEALSQDKSKDKEIAETVQNALHRARERQSNPSPSTWQDSSWQGAAYHGNKWHDSNSGSTYGTWWPSQPYTAVTPAKAWNMGEDDGWNRPFQVGAPQMTKQARVQLGTACLNAKVLDDELKKVVDDAKARQSQQYLDFSHSKETVVQIQQAQMIAESRSFVANELLNVPTELLKARRMAPYKAKDEQNVSSNEGCQDARCVVCSPRMEDKNEDSPVPESYQAATTSSHTGQKTVKRANWADQSDSECESETGASPRQRGGG